MKEKIAKTDGYFKSRKRGLVQMGSQRFPLDVNNKKHSQIGLKKWKIEFVKKKKWSQ